MKIFVQKTEPAIFEAAEKLGNNVEYCSENISYAALENDLNSGDIVFWDQIPSQGFYGSRAKVIVVATSSKTNELEAAKAGALGFIAPDLAESILVNVINCVSKGQIWMTRETIARVFDEYAKMMEPTILQPK